jgi:hypothetical protein
VPRGSCSPADLAAGSQPVAVLDRLVALGDRGVSISSNTDPYLVEYLPGAHVRRFLSDRDVGCRQLRDGQVELLVQLPRSVTLSLTGLGQVYFCRATPRDDEGVVLVDSRRDRWAEVLAGCPSRSPP